MASVNVERELVQSALKSCADLLRSLSDASQALQAKYKELGNGWKDSKYETLGNIVSECTRALSKVTQELSGCVGGLQKLDKSLDEYEGVNVNANGDRELNSSGIFGSLSSFFSTGNSSGNESSKIQQRLHATGVQNVDLRGIPLSVQEKIADAFENMADLFPKTKGCISSLVVNNNMRSSTPASTGFDIHNAILRTTMQINPSWFANGNLENIIEQTVSSGQWAGNGVAGIINHEIGHAMHLQLDANELGLGIGQTVTSRSNASELCRRWNANTTTDNIRDTVLDQMNLSRDDINSISEYAETDGSECFAECVADFTTSETPNEISVNVIREYLSRL